MPTIEDFRRRKDAFFRDDPQSPLAPAQRETFAGLSYYDEAPSLRVVATPEPFDDQELMPMQTSTGEPAHYLRWARVRFAVDGRPAELTLFRHPGSGEIFLPFQDANAGGETYGAGRYVEVEELPDGDVVVDFNYAYNPYCAYNEQWSCPLPPLENRLRVAIRAGEKSYHA